MGWFWPQYLTQVVNSKPSGGVGYTGKRQDMTVSESSFCGRLTALFAGILYRMCEAQYLRMTEGVTCILNTISGSSSSRADRGAQCKGRWATVD